jgi:hypothetical protein
MARLINNPITQLPIDSPPKMYERVIIVAIIAILIIGVQSLV